jgi:hypothetical protein
LDDRDAVRNIDDEDEDAEGEDLFGENLNECVSILKNLLERVLIV